MRSPPTCSEFARHSLELVERPIGLSMPELPLQRSDVGVDMSHFVVPSFTPAHDMIGDLLHRLDLHGDVKPVDDMRRRLRQRLRQPFHDLGAIGKDRHLAAPRRTLALKGLQRSGLKLALRCVGGREIAAWARAAPAAAASRDNDLEVPAGFRPACANIRGIDTHDEFAIWSFGRSNFIWSRSAVVSPRNE